MRTGIIGDISVTLAGPLMNNKNIRGNSKTIVAKKRCLLMADKGTDDRQAVNLIDNSAIGECMMGGWFVWRTVYIIKYNPDPTIFVWKSADCEDPEDGPGEELEVEATSEHTSLYFERGLLTWSPFKFI
jgi:hypothetical protein